MNIHMKYVPIYCMSWDTHHDVCFYIYIPSHTTIRDTLLKTIPDTMKQYICTNDYSNATEKKMQYFYRSIFDR